MSGPRTTGPALEVMYRFILWLAALLAITPAYARDPGDGIAVIIGNKTYRSGVAAVEYAHNDAEAMKRWVIDGLGYRAEDVIDLRDAGKADLETTFGNQSNPQGKLYRWVRPGRSEVVVFYSGHGIPGPRDGRGYLLPADADPNAVELSGYPLDVLEANLRSLPAKSVTVFLDACFSGRSPGGDLVNASSFGLRANPMKGGGAVAVLSAAKGSQLANWDTEARHGLFTEYLLRALYGEADKPRWGNGDGKVTLAEVKKFLDDEMAYRASRVYTRDQTPDLSGDPGRVVAAWTGQQPTRPALAPQPDRTIAPPPGGGTGERERKRPADPRAKEVVDRKEQMVSVLSNHCLVKIIDYYRDGTTSEQVKEFGRGMHGCPPLTFKGGTVGGGITYTPR